MSNLQSFRVFLNRRLIEAAGEILGAVEKTIEDYQLENGRLRRMLQIKPEIEQCQIEPLQFSEEEVPPHQKHCEQEWSPSLQQEDPEPRLIKEEEEELRTSQEEELLQGLVDTKDSILTPLCVKSECDQEGPPSRETPAEYPSVSGLKMSKLQSFHVFLNERLMVSAAVEIFRAVEKTVSEYQEENDHLRRLIQLPLEIQSCTVGTLKVSVSEEFPHEQKHCEQEWSPSLGEEDPEPTQIKEEQEELRTSQEEELHQGLFVTEDSILTPLCVKSECDQENPLVEIRETDFPLWSSTLPCPFCGKVFKFKGNLSKHMRIHTGEKPFSCGECGKSFSLKENLTRHKLTHREKLFTCADCGLSFVHKEDLKGHKLTHTEGKSFICGDCGKSYSTKKILSRHQLTHTGEKPFSCGDCGKSFSHKGDLKRHMQTHTGEKPFSCADCGKSFSSEAYLNRHMQTHTGEKPFSCDDCGKSFKWKIVLERHKRTHTGEKPFICGECGKSFSCKAILTVHTRTHTGEKPFSCVDCEKSFSQKVDLNRHIQTHTGEKPFNCVDCGKKFSFEVSLRRHKLIHTGEKPFSCGDCGKTFSLKKHLNRHELSHTGEKSLSNEEITIKT